ncbi:hypothetical protein [Arthrobacter sp. ISL-85]|uniref:hypothetical protein n=1 Tax=Arthrobacter sp. ISL-85 TaxID=2819115 RepID=UPI002034D4B9|nr:hypothetical protein [Arthrobacter sp. ISL-85]
MQESTRSMAVRDAFSAIARWTARALRALAVRPVLPAVPCLGDGSGAYTAVIRGGGTTHMATAALAYTGPDGKFCLELFRGYSPTGNARHAAAAARIDALAFILKHSNASAIHLFIDDQELRREVTAVQGSFPRLKLTATADPELSITASQAACRANSVTLNASAAAARLALHQFTGEHRTVIATDASIIPGKAGAGIAAVASDSMSSCFLTAKAQSLSPMALPSPPRRGCGSSPPGFTPSAAGVPLTSSGCAHITGTR